MHKVAWRKTWNTTLLRAVLALSLMIVLACLSSAHAATSNSAWATSNYSDEPRVVYGSKQLTATEYSAAFNANSGVFADQDCTEREYIQPSGYPVWGCWYQTVFGQLSSAGYNVHPTGKQAGPIHGWSSEFFPTKDPRVFIETPLQVDGSLDNLKFWRSEDMNFSELLPYGEEGPMYYELPDHKAHAVRDVDGSLYTFDNNLLYANTWYSANGEWMLIHDDVAGYIDLFNLSDFSRKRIQTAGVGFGMFAISDDGRYVAETISGADFSPRVIDTALCNGSDCQSIDLAPSLERRGAAPESVSLLKFHDEETLGMYAAVDYNGEWVSHQELIAQAPNTTQRKYIALGDSFASGEGAGSYTVETSGRGDANNCHTSRVSYAFDLGRWMATDRVYNVACSGAMTDHVINRAQFTSNREAIRVSDLVPGGYVQSEYIKYVRPDVITLSIGGNDIGFSTKIRRCVDGAATCFNTFEDRVEIVNEINRIYPKLVDTYKQVKDAGRQGATVYVVGYPHILEDKGKCRSGLLKFNNVEIEFSQQFVNYLNSVISQAAREAGIYYVDVSDALEKYRLCEIDTDKAAVNDFTIMAQGLIEYSVASSFHPNLLGHRLLAEKVWEQTSRMQEINPVPKEGLLPPNQYDDLVILDKMTRSGRPVYDLYYTPELSPFDEPLADKEVRSIIQNSLAANKIYKLYLESEPVLLGEYMSDVSGSVELVYKIPHGTEPGFHTLHLRGVGKSGELVDLYKDIYVQEPVRAGITPQITTSMQQHNNGQEGTTPEPDMNTVSFATTFTHERTPTQDDDRPKVAEPGSYYIITIVVCGIVLLMVVSVIRGRISKYEKS